MARESAHVGSSDAIVEFRAALLTFQEEVQAAVDAIEMKAGQTLRFLDEDSPRYWDTQVRNSFDSVNETRIALSICRNKTIAGRKSSCIEEKKAHAAARRRLETCQTQRAVARSTSVEAHEAADEFRARMTAIHRMLEADVPALQALLHKVSVSLDAYTATRPPSIASVTGSNAEQPEGAPAANETSPDTPETEDSPASRQVADEHTSQADEAPTTNHEGGN